MSEKTDRWSKVNTIAGTVTAVAVAVAAVLGLFARNANDAKSQAEAQRSTAQSAAASAQAKASQLAEQLASPQPNASASSSAIRHHGPLVLRQGVSGVSEEADLDAPASDPQWGTAIANNAVAADIYSVSTYLRTRGAKMLKLGNQRADYATCSSTTGYVDNAAIDVGTLQNGNYLCVLTGEGRYAAMRITNIGKTSISLDIITYNTSVG